MQKTDSGVMPRRSQRSLLVFLGFGVDVSEDDDVREVNPEPAEKGGHPGVKGAHRSRAH